jgi:phosphocarrier protein
MNEISQEVRISNKRGLHARASAKFVTLASGLPADITVSKDGNHVTGTSIMGLMMLGAAMGDHITIKATGPEAVDSLGKLVGLVEDKFGEE